MLRKFGLEDSGLLEKQFYGSKASKFLGCDGDGKSNDDDDDDDDDDDNENVRPSKLTQIPSVFL